MQETSISRRKSSDKTATSTENGLHDDFQHALDLKPEEKGKYEIISKSFEDLTTRQKQFVRLST